jgi:hypothetical protein
MSGRAFWIVRGLGVVGIALVHFFIYVIVSLSVMTCLGSHCDLGTGSEELDRQLRMDREVHRTIRDVMKWPILGSFELVRQPLAAALPGATRYFSDAAIVLNSLVWGIGIWVLLERLLIRRGSVRSARVG